MSQNRQRKESFKKLAELIKDIEFAMLTTEDRFEGYFRSRPMATQKFDPQDGTIWFFSSDSSPKAQEIHQEHRVNVSYSAPQKNTFVSVSGKAQILFDQRKIKELWKPTLKAWFPKGLKDPHLSLIRIEIEHAEYWDAPSSHMVELIGMIRATLMGKKPQPNALHEKLDLRH